MNSHLESAIACLNDAKKEISREFQLDEATNVFGKPLPEWAARVRDLIHSANDHVLNAKEN